MPMNARNAHVCRFRRTERASRSANTSSSATSLLGGPAYFSASTFTSLNSKVVALGISLLLLASGCIPYEGRFVVWAENDSTRDVRVVIEGSVGEAWFWLPASSTGWVDGAWSQLRDNGNIRVVGTGCVDVAVAPVHVPGLVIRISASGVVQSQDWVAVYGQQLAGPSMSPENYLAPASTCLLSSPPERTLPPHP